jgi:hypothetical protein
MTDPGKIQQRIAASATGMSREGVLPKIDPAAGRRRKKWFVLVIVGVTTLFLVEHGCKARAEERRADADRQAAVRLAEIRAASDAVAVKAAKQKESVLVGARPVTFHERVVGCTYVFAGGGVDKGRVGLSIDGVPYDAERGDRIAGVYVGALGDRWAELSYDGGSHRTYVSTGVPGRTIQGAGNSDGTSGVVGSLPPGSGKGLAGRAAALRANEPHGINAGL